MLAGAATLSSSTLDVLRVPTIQQKGQKESKERLEYTFSKHTDRSVESGVGILENSLRSRSRFAANHPSIDPLPNEWRDGFWPAFLEAAASWCAQNNTNLDQALVWITTAVDPSLGGITTFNALSTKANILTKMNKAQEAEKIMQSAIENATANELHRYGRQLLTERKIKEAFEVFEKNYKKQNGAWPTNAGMMRAYSATGDLKKALTHAKAALLQAPNQESKTVLEQAIRTLEGGKPL